MRRWRLLAAGAATAAIVGPIGYLWQQSLLPDTYSVMSMGYADSGGGPSHGTHRGGRPVSEFTVAAGRRADVSMTMVARFEGGRYTLNGTTPGPAVLAKTGDLVAVTLMNDTRFVADHPGTYWYHSHQASHDEVVKGLFGAVVIGGARTDATALVHLYSGGEHTVNGAATDLSVPAAAGTEVRGRIINTDSGPMYAWTGGPYRLLAIDGTEVHGPASVEGRSVQITAGGRADLEVTAPARVQLGGNPGVIVGAGTVAVA